MSLQAGKMVMLFNVLLQVVSGLPMGGNLVGKDSSANDNSNLDVYVWMCLERCNQTSSQVADNLAAVLAHSDRLKGVSYEMFNLGANSSLIFNSDLTQVTDDLKKQGIKTYPMVSSFPYPPEFTDWMRQVFRNPQPFIDACLGAAKKYGFDGFNIDWEPTADVVAADAVAYSQFLDTLSQSMHNAGLAVSADVATWSALWNYTLLQETSVDVIATMSTYTSNLTSFYRELKLGTSELGLEKLVVGLMPPEDPNPPFSHEELQARLQAIHEASVASIAIWRMPVPDDWWTILG